MRNSRLCHEKLTAGAYKRKFKWANFCIYCGDEYQCLDHVFPISRCINLSTWHPAVRKELGQGLNLVPACHECNRIASDTPFISITKKREYIQGKLLEKYKKYNRSVEWDEEELSEIGRALQSHILAFQSKRARIRNRLIWPPRKRHQHEYRSKKP